MTHLEASLTASELWTILGSVAGMICAAQIVQSWWQNGANKRAEARKKAEDDKRIGHIAEVKAAVDAATGTLTTQLTDLATDFKQHIKDDKLEFRAGRAQNKKLANQLTKAVTTLNAGLAEMASRFESALSENGNGSGHQVPEPHE